MNNPDAGLLRSRGDAVIPRFLSRLPIYDHQATKNSPKNESGSTSTSAGNAVILRLFSGGQRVCYLDLQVALSPLVYPCSARRSTAMGADARLSR